MRDDRQSLDGKQQVSNEESPQTRDIQGRGKHSHLVLSLRRQEPGGHAHDGDDEQADEDAPPRQEVSRHAPRSLLVCLSDCVLTR